MNIEQMTQKTREALQAAQRIAVEYSNTAVEQEHLLAAQAVTRRKFTSPTIWTVPSMPPSSRPSR